MDCPNCQWKMKRLIGDDIADWMCYGCNSLWTAKYLAKLDTRQLDQMHIDHLNSRVFQQMMAERKRNFEPVEAVEEPVVTKGGLGEWM